jgi:hypothetical protein
MGKKSKKRKKNKYNKTEFREIICNQCGLCPNGTQPDFCFDELYKINPKKFTKRTFKSLTEAKRWLVVLGHKDLTSCHENDFKDFFQMSFCEAGLCDDSPRKGEDCRNIIGCLMQFRRQLLSLEDNEQPPVRHHGRKKNKHQKNKYRKKRYVVQPYPTFFCNEEAKGEVREIIDGVKDQ